MIKDIVRKIGNVNSFRDFFLKLLNYISRILTFPKNGFNRYHIDKFMKKQSSHLKKGTKILDVGAGAKPYKTLFFNCEYESCDNENILKEIDYKGKFDHDFYCEITEKIPKPDNYYNLIICNQVLEHVSEPNLALKELHRVLESDGKLIMTVPQCHGLHQEPHNYFNYLSYGLNYLLKKNQFVDIKIVPMGGNFHLLGKVLNNIINIFFEKNNIIIRILLYPIELLIRIILFLVSFLLFYLDYFDKSKKWTLNYGCVCKKN